MYILTILLPSAKNVVTVCQDLNKRFIQMILSISMVGNLKAMLLNVMKYTIR